ncbi:MAG: YbjQ family protein [Proteobacteria bacterium]|nr:YbjQ family protein [Pseudomonadota bacterium]
MFPDYYFFLILLAVGYVTGTFFERRHFRSLERRERATMHLPIVGGKALPFDPDMAEAVAVVSGSAVISVDYFKRFLAWLKNFFGGRIKSYETLLDRARREAMLRMKELVPDADFIVGVRIETSSISKSQKNSGVSCVEAVAYGTAIRLRK